MLLLLLVAVSLAAHQLLLEPFGWLLTSLLRGVWGWPLALILVLWLFSGPCRSR